MDASRLEVLHLQSSVRGLEGETEAAQKRVRGLTDDLEDARAPFQADQGGCCGSCVWCKHGTRVVRG